MFRKLLGVLAGVGMLVSATEATDVAGPVSGLWTALGNPYNVTGYIWVPAGQTLTIQAGVLVLFQVPYTPIFSIEGKLHALGTAQDSIRFLSASGNYWTGMDFYSTADSSSLAYCVISGVGNSTQHPEYTLHANGVTRLAISNCSFQLNNTGSNFISLQNCQNFRFVGNRIHNNKAASLINLNQDTTGIIQNNIIENDTCDGSSSGSVINMFNGSSPTVNGNIIRYNSFGLNGGYTWNYPGLITCSYPGNPIITNNIIHSNTPAYGWPSNGISVISNYSLPVTVTLINNTISSAWNGIFVSNTGAVLSGYGNIIWGNQGSVGTWVGGVVSLSYSDIQGGFPGTGNINADPLFVSGLQGDFYLSQIDAGQTQQSPCVNAGNPITVLSGTTRTDQLPDAGVVDMGFHYPLPALLPSPLTITLAPINPPIIIPANGGSFSFNVTMANDSTVAVPIDAWINIIVPGGVQFTILGPVALTLPSGASLTRLRMVSVPATAPTGDYTCLGVIGDYPWMIYDTDQFAFSKDGVSTAWQSEEGWSCSGEPFPGEQPQAAFIPLRLDLSASPNPFNPSTALSYELPVASQVRLTVWDTAGRLVATLVNDRQEAGTHEARFDGTGLAAGVYIIRLKAGSFTEAQKVVLMK